MVRRVRAAKTVDDGAGEGEGVAAKPTRTEEEVLDVLDPPGDGPVIRDISGAEYRLPSELRARRQLRATRALRVVLQSADVQAAVSSRDGATMVAALLDVGTTEEGMDAFAEAFAHAHPEVLEQARDHCGCGLEADALEVFSLVAVVKALVPFYWAVVREAIEATGADAAMLYPAMRSPPPN